MANISPTTAILESMRKQALAWHIILGEMIDNAFDAGAMRVTISFLGNQLEIADDGAGCKNLLLLVTPGIAGHLLSKLNQQPAALADVS